MRTESVDIYSDQTNAAILRHPDRKYPGVLIQGDSLFSLCSQADQVCAEAKDSIAPDAYDELNDLRNSLRSLLNHYKAVLGEHQISLPFNESPGA